MLGDIIPSHKLASWLLSSIDGVLDSIGLSKDKTVEEVIYVAVIVAVSILIAWTIRKVIAFLVRKFISLHDTPLGKELLERHIITKCSHVITPLLIMCMLPLAFPPGSDVVHYAMKILIIYTLIVTAVIISTVFDFAWERFDMRDNTRNLPLRGILNVAKGIIWIVVAIIIGSVIIGKSPTVLLTGLGAFAAALMLIFKDSILGFVAGIQLSQNDMLHVGDWIMVPKTDADGIVMDVSLTAVKVRNFDNTVVTLPPSTLISTSFQNWTSMKKTGWRRIARAVLIDVDTVVPADDAMIASVKDLPHMADFIDKVTKTGQYYDPAVATVNGSLGTNLGLFRAYLCAYLLAHPKVAKDQDLMVRVMVPEGGGYPLQIYCFTTPEWIAYEAVQSEIMEHVAAMAPKFGLAIFNSPSGKDLLELHK